MRLRFFSKKIGIKISLHRRKKKQLVDFLYNKKDASDASFVQVEIYCVCAEIRCSNKKYYKSGTR